MKYLLGLIFSMSCSAYLASRKHSFGRNVYQNTYVFLSEPLGDSGDSSLIRAKLDILQGIVKEIHQNEIMLKGQLSEVQETLDDHYCVAKRDPNEEKAHESVKLEELPKRNERAANMRQAKAEQVASLTSASEARADEVQHLQELVDRQEQELQKAAVEIISVQGQLQQLNRIVQAQEDQHATQLLFLHEQLRHEKQTNIKFRDTSGQQTREITSLMAKLEDSEIQWKERMDIATAAVEAADKRGKEMAKELIISERRRRRAQVYLSLQRLLLQGLLEQM